jgi:hypothetical protein
MDRFILVGLVRLVRPRVKATESVEWSGLSAAVRS